VQVETTKAIAALRREKIRIASTYQTQRPVHTPMILTKPGSTFQALSDTRITPIVSYAFSRPIVPVRRAVKSPPWVWRKAFAVYGMMTRW